MYLSDEIIDKAIDVILNTREFCGNEIRAVRDYCADENIEDWLKIYRIANFRDKQKMESIQKASGSKS